MYPRAVFIILVTLFTILLIGLGVEIGSKKLFPGDCKKLQVSSFLIRGFKSPQLQSIPVKGHWTLTSDGSIIAPEFRFLPDSCQEPVIQKNYRWYLDGNLKEDWNDFGQIPLAPRDLSQTGDHFLLLEIKAKDLTDWALIQVRK